MRHYEVAKNGTDIPRGRVMAAIEGPASHVELISKSMRESGYLSTNCAETGEAPGDLIEFFVVQRGDKPSFSAMFKKA